MLRSPLNQRQHHKVNKETSPPDEDEPSQPPYEVLTHSVPIKIVLLFHVFSPLEQEQPDGDGDDEPDHAPGERVHMAIISEAVKPKAKSLNGHCKGYLGRRPCPNIVFLWDEEKQRAKIEYKSGNFIWLNPGQVYEIRCGRCGQAQYIET